MKKEDIRIVFMGTPDFGLPCLEMLRNEKYNIVAVITQPDRKAGRGHKLVAPPVKVWAKDNGIPVYQFEKIKDSGAETLRHLMPDLCITAAFGQILTQEFLDIPRFGIFNVHASLLPRLRGSAPIQWAIINGEKKTGITIMKTVLRLDSGDIIAQDEIDISEDMTAGQLYDMLSRLGAETLGKALSSLVDGSITYTPQKENEATYFPMFGRDFGEIDFNLDCKRIYNFVRGTYPLPGSYFIYKGIKIKTIEVGYELCSPLASPGTIICSDKKNGIKIAANDGNIIIKKLQYPGKKPLEASVFLLGNTFEAGSIAGETN